MKIRKKKKTTSDMKMTATIEDNSKPRNGVEQQTSKAKEADKLPQAKKRRRRPTRRGESSKRSLCKLSQSSRSHHQVAANRVIALFILLFHIYCCYFSSSSYHLQSAQATQQQEAPPAAEAAATAGYPPRITIQPNDLIAIEGESTELNCDAEGEPQPSIEWYHNGQLIKASSQTRTTMGGSIQFLDIRSNSSSSASFASTLPATTTSDAGIYHCLARNSLGQERSRNASLQVAYIKEEFRSAPKDKFAAIGDTITFDCLPQAWPEPTIQWRHNGKLIEPNDGSSSTRDGRSKYSISRLASTTSQQQQQQQLIDLYGSRLEIRQVDKSDEGKYSCLVETRATHRMIERESPAAILAAIVKPYFIESPQDSTAEMGGRVKLRCRLGGDPEPVISWRKQNGQPLSEKAQIDPTDKTLILDQVTLFDQAIYVCEGENSIGSARATAKVLVTSRPSFTAQPEDHVAEPGARVQMRCSGEANPPPMLYWYKEGHRQLMFAPNTPIQSSPKTPSAAEWLQAPMPLMSDNRPISDTSPAINKLFTMPLSADQPNPANFGNSFFGNRIYVDNHGTLHITNATASDSGYYACALVSSVGSVLAKAKLTIKQQNSDFLDQIGVRESLQSRSGSPISSALSKIDLLPPPVIKLGSINQTLPTNTSTTLVCDVVSQVPYKIQWLFESQPLTEEPGRVVVQDTGALSINYLRPSDSGIYTCVVTAANDQVMPMASPFEPLDSSMLTSAPPIQQSISHSSWLKVASPRNPNIQFTKMDTYALPSPPGPAYLVSTKGNDAITISWAPPIDSGSLPVKEYIVEHYDTSQEHARWKVIYRIKGKELLLVEGLSSDGSHFFVIRAVNSIGTGPSSPIAGPFRTNAFQARYDAELKRHGLSEQGRFTNDGLSFNSFKQDSRDLARERLMKILTNLISLTPISPSSVRLQWTIQPRNSSAAYLDSMTGSSLGFEVDDILEGFSIRYRAIGLGSDIGGEVLNNGWSPMKTKDHLPAPLPLPLVTSYVKEEDDPNKRQERELSNLIDYSQEFNEIRITDHSIEHYTVNELKPFTLYQFFVVPYYKDIDGVPSNILTVQTSEDRPSVAPPYLTVRPLNDTAVRLLWLHIPPHYSNGILRGYLIQVNHTGIQSASEVVNRPATLESTRYLSLAELNIATLTSYSPDARILPAASSPQYVVMYELSNLTYKSFYSIQVAAMTNVGAGPWSDTQNFIMDPRILDKMKAIGDSGFDDLIAKSMIPYSPQSYRNLVSGLRMSNLYLVLAIILAVALIISVVGYVLYRRNNQRVLTWKKTISEHFTNKFYMPSPVDQHCGANSIQQNVYDHQQHLIYAASTQIPAQSLPQKNVWQKNGRINSSETGSLSSHGGGVGGLISINNDPNSTNRRIVGEQVFLMKNNKDMASRFLRGANNQMMTNTQHPALDTACTLGPASIATHGDYYSVINNMGEYEELDSHQATMRGKHQYQGVTMHSVGGDLHQTASSNSDTSCPSSVTRLLPNQNYNRDLLNRTFNENQRLEMIVQQQGNFIYGKPQFVTTNNHHHQNVTGVTIGSSGVNSGGSGGGMDAPRSLPLSPYATTNLMSRIPQQQIFVNPVHQNPQK